MTPTSCKAKGDAIWRARTERPKVIILRAVAERSGVSQSYVSGIERGVRTCSIEVGRKIAKALGRPFDDLFDIVERLPPAWVRELEDAQPA